jgi:hypothetical protein
MSFAIRVKAGADDVVKALQGEWNRLEGVAPATLQHAQDGIDAVEKLISLGHLGSRSGEHLEVSVAGHAGTGPAAGDPSSLTVTVHEVPAPAPTTEVPA